MKDYRKLELSENLTIAPLQCFARSKRPEFLRIMNNPNVYLVSINSYIKFGEIWSICSQDIEWKQNFGLNQRP